MKKQLTVIVCAFLYFTFLTATSNAQSYSFSDSTNIQFHESPIGPYITGESFGYSYSPLVIPQDIGQVAPYQIPLDYNSFPIPAHGFQPIVLDHYSSYYPAPMIMSPQACSS